MKRPVFYVSDRTGITAEVLGHGLLTQFDGQNFEHTMIPFVDTPEKAEQALRKINLAADQSECRPLVFSTMVNVKERNIVARCNGLFIDLFETFLGRLEQELHTAAATVIGRAHGVGEDHTYKTRIDAINFALKNDDGANTAGYSDADIILLGVSRSGKTPTCLYLALQYGIMAANYPLTSDDFDGTRLPDAVNPFRTRLFGLTIDPLRLHNIREERLAESKYASLKQCQSEIRAAEHIFQAENIPYLDTSNISIEEITTTILHLTGLERRLH
ncbi:MAG: kinase/pyrophosphorylase [Gammaproteobacteria bacterium]|nr:kinase/pyrophosphorylase [Gammaproteobacteria bacterium]